jgi:FtsH-binding integral membrane protein
MPQTARARPNPHMPRVTLNSDGRRHPVENTLAFFTLLAGIVAGAVGFIVSQHVLATTLGAAALVVGLYSQLISATREQRMLIVTGLVAGFMGVALGLAHGGFVP